jgi:hypothetical protein
MTTNRRITITAAVFAVLGAATVAGSVYLQGMPDPLWLLGTLTAAYVALDALSVEVTDRVYLSSAAMVAFTSAVAFGPERSVAAVALMGAATLLGPDLIRRRRVAVALVNTGQIVLSSAMGAAALSIVMPGSPLGRSDVGEVVVAVALGSVVYSAASLWLVRLLSRLFFPENRPTPWARQLGNIGALMLLGTLGGLLGAAYLLGGVVILPPLLVAYLIGHLGFHTHSRLREAHSSTISGVMKALEALDPYTRGHTTRVVQFCELTAFRLGLDDRRVTSLRWAAHLHDVGKVAVPQELLRHPGPLGPSDEQRMVRLMAGAEAMLAEVEFLEPAIEIVRGRHAVLSGKGEEHAVEARILAAADLFDTLTSARSYREAVTQTRAFAEIRLLSERFGGEVCEALIAAIESTGEVYGSPDSATAAAVEELVRERAARA